MKIKIVVYKGLVDAVFTDSAEATDVEVIDLDPLDDDYPEQLAYVESFEKDSSLRNLNYYTRGDNHE